MGDISHTAALLAEPRVKGELVQGVSSTEELASLRYIIVVSDSSWNSVPLERKTSLECVCTVGTDTFRDATYSLLILSYTHHGAENASQIGAPVGLSLYSSSLPNALGRTPGLHQNCLDLDGQL